jgi:hypothetical protein
MRLRRLIEVEPLPESRWAKIGRALFERVGLKSAPSSSEVPARPSSRSALRPFLLAAAGVAAAAVIGWSYHPGPGRSVDDVIRPSHIVTGATGSLLVVGENSVAVSPESAVVVSGNEERGILAVVERGRVTFGVAPRLGRPPFVVQAGEVGVRVVGTRFAVTRVGDGARVDVEHGVVEVASAGTMVELRDGQTWQSGTAREASSTAVAVASPPASGNGTAEPAPAVAAEDSALPRVAPTPAAGPLPTPAHETRPRTMPATASAPQPSATPIPAPAAPSPALQAVVESTSPQSQFEQAERCERTDPTRALEMYRAVAAESGPWAMNALFAAGRLQAERGARSQARALLGDYVARYPQGPNASDARRMLDRL